MFQHPWLSLADKIQAMTPSGVRGPSGTGDRGTCPGCQHRVIAKCGTQVVHHWAHAKGGECDPWAEPETDWHRTLKAIFGEGDPNRIEVPIRSLEARDWHRADAMTREGWVVEIQSSGISKAKMREREAFYGLHAKGIIWVFPESCTDHRLLDARAPWVQVDETCTWVLHLGKRYPLAEVAPRIVMWLDEHPAPVIEPPVAKPLVRLKAEPREFSTDDIEDEDQEQVPPLAPARLRVAGPPYRRDIAQGLSVREREEIYRIRQDAADYALTLWDQVGRGPGSLRPDPRPWNEDGLLDGLGEWATESGLCGRYLTYYFYEGPIQYVVTPAGAPGCPVDASEGRGATRP